MRVCSRCGRRGTELRGEDHAPRLTRMSAAGDKDWFMGEALAAFADTLAERPGRLLPATQAVATARRAGASLYRYALAARRGDEGSAAH